MPSGIPKVPRIVGDVVVTSDWHIPYHSPTWAIKVAEASRHAPTLLIAGDFMDVSLLSHFDPQSIEVDTGGEMRKAREELEYLLCYYKRVVWTMGNHEQRILRALKYQVTFETVARMIYSAPELEVYESTTCLLDGNWRVEHPADFSTIPCKVSAELADLEHANVMCAHGHLFGFRKSKSGLYNAIDLGGIFEAERVPWGNVGGATTKPRWNNGFWILKDGVPIPVANGLTR